MSGLHTLGRRVVLGATWSKAASIDDVLASKDSLRKGDQGEAVSHVQRLLGISEDGKYGADTESAVASFQDAHVTEPHERGVVNAVTYRAIMALGPGPVAPSQSHASAAPSTTASSSEPTEETTTPVWKKILFAALAAVAVGGGALLLRRNG